MATATTTATHCPYCAFQCGMHLTVNGGPTIALAGNADFPVNAGALCVKGWTAAETLTHAQRLTHPLARNARGKLVQVSWTAALERTAERLRAIQKQHGSDAVAVFGGGSLTNEKAYLLGKFARIALGTANIDYNGRFCMSSAAAAAQMALGIDRGLPFPVEDIVGAEVILLAGANLAETMPPIMQYFERQRASGGQLIVVDPRRSLTANAASLHLRLIPGSDAALANGLLHILIRDGLIDSDYVQARTEGFEKLRGLVAGYWPERVERITGVPQAELERAARMLGAARTMMVLTARGPEQQSHGVDNTLAYLNLALATGRIGRQFSGFGSITGQGNGQGGREHGQKTDQLPGYRSITDPAARAHMAQVWAVPEAEIPGPGKSAYELFDSIGELNGVRALFVMGSNIVVSAPNALSVEAKLRKLDFLIVTDLFLSETAELADVVLPAAQWAEEDGTTTNLEGRVLLRRRALTAPEGVRTDIEILCALAAKLGKAHQFGFNGAREVFDELRVASRGGPADYFGITYEKIAAQDGVFWPCPALEHDGTPRLFAQSFPTRSGKAQFHAVRYQGPAEEIDAEYPLYFTSGRAMAQYQSGTQTRRIERLAQMAPQACLEIHPATARRFGLQQGDPVTLASRRGTATFTTSITTAIREDTVFAPFHWAREQSANRLTNAALDPVSKMPEFKVCAVRIEQQCQPVEFHTYEQTTLGSDRQWHGGSAVRGGPARIRRRRPL